MRWTDKQREIAELIKQGKTYKELMELGYANNTYARVKDALDKGEVPTIEPPPPKDPQKVVPKDQSGGQIATVVERAKGAIVFHLGELDVTLNPHYLYDSLLYFWEIRRIDPSIDEDFSLGQLAAMKHAWGHFRDYENSRKGQIKDVELVQSQEENDGGVKTGGTAEGDGGEYWQQWAGLQSQS